MSVAEHFRHRLPVPRPSASPCIPTASGAPWAYGLTLADAMNWLWNLETLRIQAAGSFHWNPLGAGDNETWTLNADLTLTKNHQTDVAYQPHERVCSPTFMRPKVTGGFAPSQASAWHRTTDLGDSDFFDIYPRVAFRPFASFGTTAMVRKHASNGTYQLFESSADDSGASGTLIISEDIGGAWSIRSQATGGATSVFLHSQTVAGATLDYYLRVDADALPLGLVVDSFSVVVTPTFFTYV